MTSLPLLLLVLAPGATPAPPAKPGAVAQLLEHSSPSDWRPLDPENTLYLELAKGRVVIELAPAFAPNHVRNVKALAHESYFDGLSILRVQDNYVVQWGDPDAEDPPPAQVAPAPVPAHARKSLGIAEPKLTAEFSRKSAGLPFTPLPDPDTYAPEVGFSMGFPVARDPKSGQSWLVHCYGMVGAGRDNPKDSSNGAELYAVIGHSPRHLDRNVTLLGRVVSGIDLLSSLPRGTGALGFYEKPSERTPLVAMRLATDVPPAQRTALEALRTDTPLFEKYVDARRNRRDAWFVDPVGHVEVCNVGLPVRAIPSVATAPKPSK